MDPKSLSGKKDNDNDKIVYLYYNDLTNPRNIIGKGSYGLVFKGMYFN